MTAPTPDPDETTSNKAGQNKRTIAPLEFAPSQRQMGAKRFQSWQLSLGTLTLTIIAGLFWFVFTAKSVQLTFQPQAEQVEVSGGLYWRLGNVYLMRPGRYQVAAFAEEYEAFNAEIQIDEESYQSKTLSLIPLPGRLAIDVTPHDAQIWIDGIAAAEIDLRVTTEAAGAPASPKTNDRATDSQLSKPRRFELAAGEHQITLRHPWYFEHTLTTTIIGRNQEQSIAVNLDRAWANIRISSDPQGAIVLLDQQTTGISTPGSIRALAGEHLITLQKPGFKVVSQRVYAEADTEQTLEQFNLEQADAQLMLTSQPAGAAVTLNSVFVGATPLRLDLASEQAHRLSVIAKGYTAQRRTLTLQPGEERQLNLQMSALMGEVFVELRPADAQLRVNGELISPPTLTGTLVGDIGSASYRIDLPTRPHDISVTLDGYAGFVTQIDPIAGIPQSLKVKLLTNAQARRAALTATHTSPDGQLLRLFEADKVAMGASRREPGRRANETLRQANFTRLFYLAEKEVTNAQFRAFASGHDSGDYEQTDLNDEAMPVSRVSWDDAAAYCNWLSKQAQLPPFYVMEFGKVVSINAAATGYRLPTEAEWAWTARNLPEGQRADGEQLRFAWGDAMPPPERFENYADRAAANLVGRIIFAYNDNYAGPAPVATFAPNHYGLFDMGGNVAEWMHDFYAVRDNSPVIDDLGPTDGQYHVIRGASWKHGTITELRLSFRDYGSEAREDVGFRIARYAE